MCYCVERKSTMYNIEIYEDAKGRSDIQELLEDLH